MSTQGDPTHRRDDAAVRIVAHRLQQIVGADVRQAEARARKSTARLVRSVDTGGEEVVESGPRLPQIVLVDRDVDALREIAVALREQCDFHVTISGNEALNLLQTGAIDAIVVGQTLYSSTGMLVLAEARRRAPNVQRVLLANAAEAMDIEREAPQVTPFRVLERPCTPQKLRDLLATIETKNEPAANEPLSSAKPRVPPTKAARQSITSTNHADYEHVVLETPPTGPRQPQPRLTNDPLATAHLPVIVYTDNAEFYRAICNALADHHDVRLATQLQNAVEMAEMGMCPILITDRAGTQTELQRISIAIRASEPALVTIASGSPTEGMALRKLLNTSALHSFLPKPLSAPLVRLTVESAKRHHLQLKAPREPLAASPAETPATLRTTGPRAATYQPGQIFERNFDIEDRFDFRRLFPYARIAVLVLLIAAAGGWYWQQRSQQQAQITALIDDDLSRARQAYDAGDYVAPENASALYYYRRVLNRDAKHAQALRGVDDIVERIIDQIERQLTEDKLDSAAQSIALLRELRPDHKRIDFLDNQVRKASAYRQAQRLAEQSAQVAREEAAKATAANARLIEARVSDSSLPTINNSSQRMQAVGRWLAAARQRMNQGRLVAPESDNAEYFFRLAERADPNNTAVEDGLHEIGGRLLNEAQDALNKQQLDVARKRLADAGRFGADANVITRIQSDINAAADTNTRANFLRLTLQRTRENALFEPAQDNAKYYLSQLQRLDPNGAETQQASRAIALKLLDNANEATAQKQFNISIRLLDEARRLGFNGAELSEADKKLQLARNPTPATPSDTAPRTTPPRILKSVAAKYPDDAMAAGISGWVDVGFKINRSGDVYDAVAMGSSAPAPYAPKFERAAVAAISQYKFEQRTISDTQTQSMVVRVQFKAK